MSDNASPCLDLEMSLLLPSSAPATWGAAVHEAARLLVGINYPIHQGSWDLRALSFVLYSRTYAGRPPQEVALSDLRAAFSGPADREPGIIGEIDEALTATGQGYDTRAHKSMPLWSIFREICDRYGDRIRGSALADDIEPPVPGPSPMRAAAQRLAEVFAEYPAKARDAATVPEIASAPLLLESQRIQVVTGSSVRRLSCAQGCEIVALRVDGPEAIQVCSQGHESRDWELDAVRARLAFARTTGALPSAAGTFQVQELRIASTTLPRDSDPEEINVFLRPQPELFGREGVLDRLRRLVDRPS
ncbi:MULTISPECIES: hypothetical protein [unclassified Streptomyces]|uniref:hypothetical protein n=1 Tax=unclassified Streptomyces TaxID=2593676 RepID=UPI0013A6D60D|nr:MULTISPECIES: hypothetical protein [unclassified Streptomyces]